jgi:hypothetical protein
MTRTALDQQDAQREYEKSGNKGAADAGPDLGRIKLWPWLTRDLDFNQQQTVSYNFNQIRKTQSSEHTIKESGWGARRGGRWV